jgi:hypothetical protein
MWREKSKNDVIEKTNRIITKGNIFRSNLLVITAEYWNDLLSINYKLGDKKNYEFFYNSLILKKNNKDINRYLKNFFIRNYSDFSPDERRIIISEF